MALLSKNEILAVDDRQVVSVQVPEWGGEVGVRTLMGSERAVYEDIIMRQDHGGKLNEAVALFACDENGKPIFTAADVEALGKKNSVALLRVFRKGVEINRLEPKAMEEAKGN